MGAIRTIAGGIMEDNMKSQKVAGWIATVIGAVVVAYVL